jgi:hypothetical protein
VSPPFRPGQLLRSHDLNELIYRMEKLEEEIGVLREKIAHHLTGEPSDFEPEFAPSCLTVMPGEKQWPLPFTFALRQARTGLLIPVSIVEATPDKPWVKVDCQARTIVPEGLAGDPEAARREAEKVHLTVGARDGGKWTVELRLDWFDPKAWDIRRIPAILAREADARQTMRMTSVLMRTHTQECEVPTYPVTRRSLTGWLPTASRSVLLLFHLQGRSAEAVVMVARDSGEPLTFRCPLLGRDPLAGESFQEVLLSWEGDARGLEVEGAAVVGIGHRKPLRRFAEVRHPA